VDRLATAAFVVAAQPVRDATGDAAQRDDAAAAQWFDDAAKRIAARRPPPSPPVRLDASAQIVVSPATPFSVRSAIDARGYLQREIEHVVANPT
jgi:hypothetical protein